MNLSHVLLVYKLGMVKFSRRPRPSHYVGVAGGNNVAMDASLEQI